MHHILSKSTKSSFVILCALVLSCTQSGQQFNIDEAYVTRHHEYQKRLAKGREYYLKLAGLFKFDQEVATLGSDPNANFFLDTDGMPETLGFFHYANDTLFFSASENIEVATDTDAASTRVRLTLDEYGSSQKMKYDRFEWRIITRGGGYYVRIWDHENPAIAAFKTFGFYDLDPNLILEGEFSYFSEAKKDEVPSQLGVEESTTFIGQVKFNYQGKEHTLDVGQNGFTMVGDATTGVSNYGGGRYIYLDLPESDSTVMVDFNYLYNPPCSFSNYTTCLYPPEQNKLPFEIVAGEKYH